MIRKIIFYVLFLCCFCNLASAQDKKEYIYCVITDDYNDAAYFTEVFKGRYDELDQYEARFITLISAEYGKEFDPGVHCTFEQDEQRINAEYQRDLEDNGSFYQSILTLSLL